MIRTPFNDGNSWLPFKKCFMFGIESLVIMIVDDMTLVAWWMCMLWSIELWERLCVLYYVGMLWCPVVVLGYLFCNVLLLLLEATFCNFFPFWYHSVKNSSNSPARCITSLNLNMPLRKRITRMQPGSRWPLQLLGQKMMLEAWCPI